MNVRRNAALLVVLVGTLSPWAKAQTTQSSAQPLSAAVPMGTAASQLLLSKITVSDLAKSFEFYTKVIGLRHAAVRPGQAPPDLHSKNTEIPLNYTGTLADPFFVIQKRPGATPTRETARLTVIGFKVPDARAVVQRVKAAGYVLAREPRETAPGANMYIMVQDPDGYTIELIQAPSVPAQGPPREE